MPRHAAIGFLSVLLAGSLLLGAGRPAWAATSGEPDPAALLGQAQERLLTGAPAEALALIDRAAQVVWNRMGLTIASALLTQEEAQGYGIYNARDDKVYAQGEPVLAYVEPLGYKVSSPLPGLYVFGISVDVAILRPDGEEVWGKENFFEKTVESRRFNRDFYLNITLETASAPPGDYVLKLTVHDKLGGPPAEARLPISIK